MLLITECMRTLTEPVVKTGAKWFATEADIYKHKKHLTLIKFIKLELKVKSVK